MAETAEKLNMANEPNPNISMHPILNLKQGGKPSLPVIAGILIVLIGAGALSFFLYREYSMKKQALTALAQAEQDRARLETSVSQLKAEMDKQKEEMSKLATDFEAAAQKSAETEKLLADREGELTKVYGEVTQLKKTLKERDTLIATLESNIRSLKTMLDEKGKALGPMTLAGPGGAIQGLQSEEQGAESPASLEGKVLQIDLKNRFVVINLGPAQGAEQGKWIQIYRNKELVGSARIDRTYQNLSAATVLSEDTLNRVEKGDQVYITLS